MMRRAATMVAAVVLAISVPTTVAAFETPEAAVREYLEGVAHADIDRVLEATAVDEAVEGYRFDEAVERIQSFGVGFMGPVHSPFFAGVQRADWTRQLLWQTRMLAYSLLAPDVLGVALEGRPVTDADGPWASDLVAALDEERLSGLVLAEVGLPLPEVHDTEYLEIVAEYASNYGADEWTERVALVVFEGETYAVGFTLLRYGDEWKVWQQRSALSGLPGFGTAQPMTSSEFSDLTSE